MRFVDSSVTSDAPRRPWRTRGGLVTVATVTSLVAALGLTVLGLGAADQAVASYDAASWVWSRGQGEVARINGVTARVDTRVDVAQAKGHRMELSQSDRFVLLRDFSTGQISSLDLVSLQVGPTTQRQSGMGVSVALRDDAAFVIDAVQGEVQQLDPRSLAPIGDTVRFPPGITGGIFDGEGRLWIAVPSEGTVTAISAAPLPSTGTAGGSARQIRTAAVAAASHDLMLSALDTGVAVLDRTTNQLTTVHGDDERVTPLALPGPGAVPNRTVGTAVPVTATDERRVFVVASQQVREITVPGSGALRPAVAWQGRIYCADEAAGTVHVFDAAGQPTTKIDMKGGGPLELEVRENHLFINAPDSASARVVDDKSQVHDVDKYPDKVLGGDPPPEKPKAPPPAPEKPPAGKPGAPKSVTAAAGNAQVKVSWQAAPANGAPIQRYVVEGGGTTIQVGANQRSVDIAGLTNGEEYRFTVHAENAKGAGPGRTSNPVRPTAEVPDAPASVTAEPRPDGTVVVTWAAANGQGLAIHHYAVSATSATGTVPVGEATETDLVVKAGELQYGTQYAFSVVAFNEQGAASKASPISGSVVPFTKPGRPEKVDAATVGDKAGTISVSWDAAAENGRAITRYVVKAGDATTNVTDGTKVTLTGFDHGKSVSVQVRAVNEAGEGEAGTATAQTVALPTVTVQSWDATQTGVTVTMSVNAGGGRATCKLDVQGKGSVDGDCSTLTVNGLLPATDYTVTVTPHNAAGDGPKAAKTMKTDAVKGITQCVNAESSKEHAQRTWCDQPLNGREVFSAARQSSTRLGKARNKHELDAICKTTGENISPYIYSPKSPGEATDVEDTATWIKVTVDGMTGYMSFAWITLNGYDAHDTGPLPTC